MSILHNALCLLHNALCLLHNALCLLHNALCLLCNALCQLLYVYCTMLYVYCTMLYVYCTMLYVYCTMLYVNCSMLYVISFVLRPIPGHLREDQDLKTIIEAKMTQTRPPNPKLKTGQCSEQRRLLQLWDHLLLRNGLHILTLNTLLGSSTSW